MLNCKNNKMANLLTEHKQNEFRFCKNTSILKCYEYKIQSATKLKTFIV